MAIFGHTIPSAGGGFPIAAWLRATTSGQPGVTASSISHTGSGASVWRLSGNRALALVRNTSGHPVAQIGTNAPAVGSAVTILASNVAINFVQRLKSDTNRFLLGINNDLYLVDCGASGTTVTVTQVSTDAGDSGKGEAWSTRTRILVAEDDSHFVVCNEFDNGGFRTFVSALFTITYGGTPAATYVTRALTVTGGSASLTSGNTFGGDTSTAGLGFYCGLNASTETTSLRFNKITYTSSTVSNSVNTVTLGTAATSVAQFTACDNFAEADRCAIRYGTGTNQGVEALISYSGTPAVDSEIDSGSRGISDVNQYASSRRLDAFGCRAAMRASSGGGTVGFEFISPHNDNVLMPKYALVTGLTTPAAYAIDIDDAGEYAYFIGKTSTNTGFFGCVKNADV